MIKHRMPAPTRRRSAGGLTGYLRPAVTFVARVATHRVIAIVEAIDSSSLWYRVTLDTTWLTRFAVASNVVLCGHSESVPAAANG
jgi:hypothetical protein